MSKILDELVSNKISLEECLQRLLIIANKINNIELAKWCSSELNGYKKFEDLPEYRKTKSGDIVYSGINGSFQVTNNPIQPGYLSKETLDAIEEVGIFENITSVANNKDSEHTLHRDLTFLASEVYKNTNNGYKGVQCTSISQVLSPSIYSNVYSCVKTRIINLLCSFESANINVDKIDIKGSIKKDIEKHNASIYKTIVLDGETYVINPKEHKVFWMIIIPILTAIVSGVLVYLITNVWIN